MTIAQCQQKIQTSKVITQKPHVQPPNWCSETGYEKPLFPLTTKHYVIKMTPIKNYIILLRKTEDQQSTKAETVVFFCESCDLDWRLMNNN